MQGQLDMNESFMKDNMHNFGDGVRCCLHQSTFKLTSHYLITCLLEHVGCRVLLGDWGIGRVHRR